MGRQEGTSTQCARPVARHGGVRVVHTQRGTTAQHRSAKSRSGGPMNEGRWAPGRERSQGMKQRRNAGTQKGRPWWRRADNECRLWRGSRAKREARRINRSTGTREGTTARRREGAALPTAARLRQIRSHDWCTRAPRLLTKRLSVPVMARDPAGQHTLSRRKGRSLSSPSVCSLNTAATSEPRATATLAWLFDGSGAARYLNHLCFVNAAALLRLSKSAVLCALGVKLGPAVADDEQG